MSLVEAIKKAKEEAPERKFSESVDLFINFRGIDFSKPENKINLEVALPKGRGRPRKVCFICEEEFAGKAKGIADKVIVKDELATISKKDMKKLAEEYDSFVAQANLMPIVGKSFGPILAPRGKMPKPVPPTTNLEPILNALKRTVVLKTKGKNMPVLHVPIGTRDMSDEDLADNVKAVLNALTAKLPQKQHNIKSVLIKTTMGPTVKIEV